VKLNVHEIEEVAKELVYEESTDSLNTVFVHGQVCDYEFPAPADVRVQYYRAGRELFFHGHISGGVVGHCGRCLEEYRFDFGKDFSLVLVPKEPVADDAELGDDDLDLSFYEGDEVDLSPLVREQIILALPTRPLCQEDCKGLCPRCGVDRNLERCDCAGADGDPRFAVLRNLKVGH
jgi:DUF177 domain-containing protein